MSWLQFGRSNESNPNLNAPKTQSGLPPQQDQLVPKNNGNPPPNGPNEPGNSSQNNADPSKGPKQDSPLDTYKDIFTIPVDEKGAPIAPPPDPLSGKVINFDAQKVADSLKGKNFLSGVNPELLEKVNAGNNPQALMELLNTVVGTTLQHSIAVSASMAENAIQANNERFEKALPDRIRGVQLRQSTPKNPILSNPAIAPMVEAFKLQLASKNPQLSPQAIQDYTDRYFQDVAVALTGVNSEGTPHSQNSKQGKEPDWSALLDL